MQTRCKLALGAVLVVAAQFAVGDIDAGAAKPIDAGSRLQVLWDDHVVDTAKTTASRVVHQPEYVGVAMTHEKPWEGDGSDWATGATTTASCRTATSAASSCGCTTTASPSGAAGRT